MFAARNKLDEERRLPARELLSQVASAYFRRGWSFIPLMGKRPAVRRWKEFQLRLPTAEEASAWFADPAFTGVGVVTGKLSGLVVVDCDTPEDAAYWRDGFPSSPLCVKTGGGGLHVYYQAPENLGVGNRVKIHRRLIDVRGEGGYVAAPPSRHPSGHRYAWTADVIDLDQPLPAFDPAWLVDPRQPAPSLASDLPTSAVRHVVAYIRRIQATSGEGGHNATFRAACKLRDAGLSPTEALSILGEWNATNAHPPWSEKELIHKIQSAFSVLTR